jgi:hypothetical protein
MSRIILRLTPKRPSTKGGSLRRSGQRAFSSRLALKTASLFSRCSAAPPATLCIRLDISSRPSPAAPASICASGVAIFAGKQHTRSLSGVGRARPHPPASARLSRGRVWSAKAGLPLTSQQSLCRYIYSHNIHHLGAPPPPTLPLHCPSRAHRSWIPSPSLPSPQSPLSKGSSRCTSRHNTIAAALH